MLTSSQPYLQGFHKIVVLPSGLPLHYSIADINALLAKVTETPSLPAVLPPQPTSGPPRGGLWTRGNVRGRGAFRGGGSRYATTSERESPWRQRASHTQVIPVRARASNFADTLVNPRLSVSQIRNGRSPPARITRDAARQASHPYSAAARQDVIPVTSTALSTKKGASTGFIDVSSDEEKQ